MERLSVKQLIEKMENLERIVGILQLQIEGKPSPQADGIKPEMSQLWDCVTYLLPTEE